MEFLVGVLTGAHSLDGLIRWGGYALLVAIVFTETGLLVGFFLPGDSLLITAGLVAATGALNIWWINALLILAAVVGDSVGYAIGARLGPALPGIRAALAPPAAAGGGHDPDLQGPGVAIQP